MKPNPTCLEDPLYPSYDGMRRSDNEWHLLAIFDALQVLDARYQDRLDVYVTGDLLIYYEEGKPQKRIAPDVFVVLGAAKHNRMNYKLWEEPKPPDFVLEVVASQNAREQALGYKRSLYAALGVREYWLFDPKGDFLDPPLHGLRLSEGAYYSLPAFSDNGVRRMRSEALGLDLRAEHGVLRFWDPLAGRYLKNHSTLTARAEPANALEAESAATALAKAEAAKKWDEAMRETAEVIKEVDEAMQTLRSAKARIAELELRLRGLSEICIGE